MNTSNIKKYAPIARRDFMAAVAQRLNQFGISNSTLGLQVSEPVISGSVMQIDGNLFDAAFAPRRARLVARAERVGFEPLVELVAYTWFNRLCAIRFMELKEGYLEHGFRVLSHPEKPNGFEILDHAQDVALELGLNRDYLIELKLAGNKDEELYRELLLGQCHQLHQAMPFLFEALDDETELLLPDNLIRTDSVLRGLVDEIPEGDWLQVEVIGWLYQFYISEKKDQVIGKVVKSEDIPAATQLFTPNWIVKYLVQNSVGRQWLQTYPESSIKGQMEYYIEPAVQTDEVHAQLTAITPASIEPESIKVLDPACGSGHILVEAYNVLKAIYEERGYRSRDIPKLILENNLFGLDLDDRAAQLSGFALMMMARNDDRRVFSREIKLNVFSLQESGHLDLVKVWQDLNLNKDVMRGSLQLFDDVRARSEIDKTYSTDNRYVALGVVLDSFTQAKTFGSLIDVPMEWEGHLRLLIIDLEQLAGHGEPIQKASAKQVLPLVRQAWILAQRYDAVVANPPYMGGKGMNLELKNFSKNKFPDSKSDLFSMFIDMSFSLVKKNGFSSMVTMQSWMFLSSFVRLRENFLKSVTINTMVHLPYEGKVTPLGINFGSIVYCVQHFAVSKFKSKYFCVGLDNVNDANKPTVFPPINGKNNILDTESFLKIPGGTLAYWCTEDIFDAYEKSTALDFFADPRQGLATGDNDSFLREWSEVSHKEIIFDATSKEDVWSRSCKWVPCTKGGAFRRWYGNRNVILKFDKNSYDALSRQGNNLPSKQFYFQSGWTWSTFTNYLSSFRFTPVGSVFETKGSICFPRSKDDSLIMGGYLNSSASQAFLGALSPTVDYHEGPLRTIPYPLLSVEENGTINDVVEMLVDLFKEDWDSSEESWDFLINPMVSKDFIKLKNSFLAWQQKTKQVIDKAIQSERVLNGIFNNSFQISPNDLVTLRNITLRINPNYRYANSDLTNSEQRLQSDTISELISYSIGCMMGRYSLDREGLVYAHAGNQGFADLVSDGAYQSYPADDDGILPLTDQEWFEDDVTNRFRDFIRTAWSAEHLQENLAFVAESLCLYAIKPKRGESSLETIRRYLSTQFYKDHLKTYKKRPIYWLFSSGKLKAFECLVYLHRYNESTLSRMRTEYVTPLIGKYAAHAAQLQNRIDNSSSTAETSSLKSELTALEKKQVELLQFDDKLKYQANKEISIDLDDGVKVNYGKFGDLLADVKAITGDKQE